REEARQVALIGEACLRGDVRQRPALKDEQAGAQDAKLSLKGVRRHAILLGEDTVEVIGTEVGDGGKLIQANVLGIMLGEVIVSAPDRLPVRGATARR